MVCKILTVSLLIGKSKGSQHRRGDLYKYSVHSIVNALKEHSTGVLRAAKSLKAEKAQQLARATPKNRQPGRQAVMEKTRHCSSNDFHPSEEPGSPYMQGVSHSTLVLYYVVCA